MVSRCCPDAPVGLAGLGADRRVHLGSQHWTALAQWGGQDRGCVRPPGPEGGLRPAAGRTAPGASGTGRGRGADRCVCAGPLTGSVWRGGGLRPRLDGTLSGLGCGFLDQRQWGPRWCPGWQLGLGGRPDGWLEGGRGTATDRDVSVRSGPRERYLPSLFTVARTPVRASPAVAPSGTGSAGSRGRCGRSPGWAPPPPAPRDPPRGLETLTASS